MRRWKERKKFSRFEEGETDKKKEIEDNEIDIKYQAYDSWYMDLNLVYILLKI